MVERPRRALILAGGGTKVAYQAGVLQVWLDEAGIDFDLADGASGGVLNLAMWCQGMSGREIADNWRRYDPLDALEPAFGEWLRLPVARSLLRLERFRRNVLQAAWGVDVEAMRATSREATFNLYDVTNQRLEVREPAAMDEDLLLAAIALPTWFPPVEHDEATYIDAVYATDANLEEAIRRGADELWIVWTVSRAGRWRHGPVHHYFQTIEAAANSALTGVLERIDANNDALARGGHGEFGRHIEVHLLEAEVPLHYLLNFTAAPFRTAVDQGVADARAWCRERGIAVDELPPSPVGPEVRSVTFTEVMEGPFGSGAREPGPGVSEGRRAGTLLGVELTIEIDDVDRFVTDERHEARATGTVYGDAVGGNRPVDDGRFNLFVEQGERDKRMLYRLHLHDADGNPRTLFGYKIVRNGPGAGLWSDTTTLFTRLLDGHVDAGAGNVLGAGILRITPKAFARQLTTFRATGSDPRERAGALVSFGRLFAGHLWDVYGPVDSSRIGRSIR